MSEPIRQIAIVGGGVTAWSVAAVLAEQLKGRKIRIAVVSDGEAELHGSLSLLPSSHGFHRLCGLDEQRLMRKTGATFKLGSAYSGWTGPRSRFMHSYSPVGEMLDAVEFHHYLVRLREEGHHFDPEGFSVSAVAAKAGRFGHPVRDSQSPLAQLSYAYHVGRDDYRALMRDMATSKGVREVDGPVTRTRIAENDAFIESLILADGTELNADFFFDCGGPGAPLMNAEHPVDHESWSAYLPCDRIVGVTRPHEGATRAFTEYKVAGEGWQRVVPLAARTNSELHYSSRFLDDAAAATQLQQLNPDAASADFYFESRNPGHRQRYWTGNCVAIGSTAGHAGGLVVSDDHLAQSAILRWLRLFPDAHCDAHVVAEYDRTTADEYERVLDANAVLLMAAAVDESPFWRALHDVQWPDSLVYRVKLFREIGKLAFYESESVSAQVWISLLLGMEVWPERYDMLADDVPTNRLVEHMQRYQSHVQSAVDALPNLDEALDRAESAATT